MKKTQDDLIIYDMNTKVLLSKYILIQNTFINCIFINHLRDFPHFRFWKDWVLLMYGSRSVLDNSYLPKT